MKSQRQPLQSDPRNRPTSIGPIRVTKSGTQPSAPAPEGPAKAVPGRSPKAKVAR